MSAYDKASAVRYDQIINQPVYKYYVNKKLNLIIDWLKPKSVLLDVGCGTGVYTTFLAKRCETIVGLDVSREMILRGLFKARHQGLDNVYFVIGDVANAPIQDRVFDLVFSVNTFHHFSTKETVLKGLAEKARCCKHNCPILIFELNPNSLGWSKNTIPKMIRGFIYLLLFPFRQRVIDHVEERTQMINVPELLRKTGRIKLISMKVGGFIPTYSPKSVFKIFVLLEKIMEVTPLLRRYGAHTLVVGEVQ